MEPINPNGKVLGSTAPTAALRPNSWKQFIGQQHLRSLIQTSAKAARHRNAPFPHVLITGAAGMGKTCLAALIAAEMGVELIATTAEALEDSNSLHSWLSKLCDKGYDRSGNPVGPIKPSVLFLDEVHRLPRPSQELLYSCLEDRVIEVRKHDIFSKNLVSRKEWIPFFTLACASNRPGDLTTSFRDRLRLHLRLEPYTESESAQIVQQALLSMGLKCAPKLASLIAGRGRGVPRRILGICEGVRDQALVAHKKTIDLKICKRAFDAIGLDPIGLSRSDIAILKMLAAQVGYPLGLKTLAASIGEDERTLEEALEPFLLEKGLVARTPRGRTITPNGVDHLRIHHGLESNRRTLG